MQQNSPFRDLVEWITLRVKKQSGLPDAKQDLGTRFVASNMKLLERNAKGLIAHRWNAQQPERAVLWRAYRGALLSRAMMITNLVVVFIVLLLIFLFTTLGPALTLMQIVGMCGFCFVAMIGPSIHAVIHGIPVEDPASLARWTERMLAQNHCPSCCYPVQFDTCEPRKAKCPECGIEYKEVPASSVHLIEDQATATATWRNDRNHSYTADMLLVQRNARKLLRHRWNFRRPEQGVLWRAYCGVLLSRLLTLKHGMEILGVILIMVFQSMMMFQFYTTHKEAYFIWALVLVLPVVAQFIKGVDVDKPTDLGLWTESMLKQDHCPSCGTRLAFGGSRPLHSQCSRCGVEYEKEAVGVV